MIFKGAKSLIEMKAQSVSVWDDIADFRRMFEIEPEYVRELMKFSTSFFINPNPRKHIHSYEKLIGSERESNYESLQVDWVDWDRIRLIQPSVYNEGVRTYTSGLQSGKLLIPPICFESQGFYIVVDGTHRLISLYESRAIHNLNSNEEGLFVLRSPNGDYSGTLYKVTDLEFV